jgi:hypothetical protein
MVLEKAQLFKLLHPFISQATIRGFLLNFSPTLLGINQTLLK